MELTLQQMDLLSREFDDNLTRYNENINKTEIVLKKTNNSIHTAFERNVFDPAFLDFFIQIGTLLRRGNNFCKQISFSFFLITNKYFNSRKNTKQEIIAFTRYLLFYALDKLNNNDDFKRLGKKLVWFDEEKLINEKMIDIPLFKKGDINNFYSKYKKEFIKFELFGSIHDIKNSIKKIIEFTRPDNDEKIQQQARKVLSYLVLQKDIIDDDLGIFGLADDLHVINELLLEHNDPDNSHKLLKEFLVSNNNILNLFFERNYKNIKKLTASSPHVNFIISSINYLIKTGKKRIIPILPEASVIAFLLLLNFVTTKKSQDKKEQTINREDIIYFNLPNRSIAVKYLGPDTQIKDVIWISDIEEEGSNATMTLPRIALSLCTLKPSFKRIEKNASLVNDWQQINHYFVPQYLTFNNNGKLIFYLTTKYKFEEYVEELRPFGSKIKEFIRFNYNEIKISKKANVNVFSNADSLHEAIDEVENKEDIIIVCDTQDLAKRFLLNLNEAFGYEKMIIIIFSSVENISLNENSKKHKFSTLYFKNHISNFKNINHEIGFNDSLSSYEEKLELSSKKVELNFHSLDDPFFEKFNQILKEIFKQYKLGQSQINDNILFKLIRYKDIYFKRWYPLSESEITLASKIKDEILRSIQSDIQFDTNLNELFSILETQQNNLETIIFKRGILDYLRHHLDRKFLILEDTDVKKQQSINYLKSESIFNTRVSTKMDLVGKFVKSRNIIIPYLLKDNINRYIKQNNTSDQIELFLFESEKKDFEYQNEKTNKDIYKLRNDTKKSFNESPVMDLFKEDKTNDININRKQQHISDFERDIILDRIKKDTVSDRSKEIDAIPIILNNKNKLIYLSPGSKIILRKEKNNHFNFSELTASNLYEGCTICIPIDSKTDMFEELASRFKPEYSDIKIRATEWKKHLNNLLQTKCRNDTNSLTKFLNANGIKRSIATIRNWISNDSSLIAPRNFEDVLPILFSLNGIENVKDKIIKAKKDIDRCYKIRLENSEKIIEILNERYRSKKPENKIEISVGNASLQLELFQIDLIENSQKIEIEKLWKINDF